MKANKTLEIYRAPQIFIFNFKRFKFDPVRPDFAYGTKLETFVDFPIDGLNMTPYVTLHPGLQTSLIYDLYAVSNHVGSLEYGHYTAVCKNSFNQLWYIFDD